MSSMRAPQKLREMRACIAKLPPQQRICHLEELPSLTRKTQCVNPPRALQRRSGKSFSQDRVGELFFLDLLQFCNTEKHPPRGNTRIFLFNSSSGGLEEENIWLEARLLQLSVEECPLVWKHKDLVSRGAGSCRTEGWNWGPRKLFRAFVALCEQQKSPQSQSDCFHLILVFIHASLLNPTTEVQTRKHTVAHRTSPKKCHQRCDVSHWLICGWINVIILRLMTQPVWSPVLLEEICLSSRFTVLHHLGSQKVSFSITDNLLVGASQSYAYSHSAHHFATIIGRAQIDPTCVGL